MAKFNVVMKALSSKTRREILLLLRKEGVMNAGDIASKFAMTQATVSHHLAFLIDAELVLSSKQGKYIYYEINTSILEEILEWIYALIDKEDNQNDK